MLLGHRNIIPGRFRRTFSLAPLFKRTKKRTLAKSYRTLLVILSLLTGVPLVNALVVGRLWGRLLLFNTLVRGEILNSRL